MTRIALIGAGRMGQAMGRRLLAAGHPVTVHDGAPAPVDDLVGAGARAASSPGEAVADAEVTLVSLPIPPVVENVVLSEDGVIAHARPGSVVIDVSTGPPELARRMAGAGRAGGISVLDAPVSGGPLGAAAGTLAIMVGGDPEAVRRAAPVLEVLGATIRHMGPPGTGQATKLANNLLAAAQMAALAEAVALTEAEGLDPHRVYEVISGASGDSSVLRQRFPVPGVLPHAPASNEWAALFPVDLLIKDVRLALAAARRHGLELPVTALALERYAAAHDAGWGDLDYSTIARLARAPRLSE